VLTDELADVSDPTSKLPIEVDEGDFETLRQKSTDRALPVPPGPTNLMSLASGMRP